MSEDTRPLAPEQPPIAGEDGFIISLGWDAIDIIDEVLTTLATRQYVVAVTPNEGEPFDATIVAIDDGIFFRPYSTDTLEYTGHPVPFRGETIDGIHVY